MPRGGGEWENRKLVRSSEVHGRTSLPVGLEGMRKWGPSCLALQTELYEIRLGTTRKRLALPIVIFGGIERRKNMLKP